jgi:hypothetical protein
VIVYRVFYKNYDLKKDEFIGALVERRRALRGKTKVETGLRWARSTFSQVVKDKHAIFVVPGESNLEISTSWFIEDKVFNEEELHAWSI